MAVYGSASKFCVALRESAALVDSISMEDVIAKLSSTKTAC
jgi:hypothetical protein